MTSDWSRGKFLIDDFAVALNGEFHRLIRAERVLDFDLLPGRIGDVIDLDDPVADLDAGPFRRALGIDPANMAGPSRYVGYSKWAM